MRASVPTAAMRPRAMIATWSVSFSNSSSSWLDTSRHFPCSARPAEQVEEFAPADRVDAGERLVEHEQFRVVDQRGGQLDRAAACPSSSRECGDWHGRSCRRDRARAPVRSPGFGADSSRRAGPSSRRTAGRTSPRRRRPNPDSSRRAASRCQDQASRPADGRTGRGRPQTGPVASRRSVLFPAPLDADQARDAGPQFERHLIDAEHRAVPLRDVLEQEQWRSGQWRRSVSSRS